MTLTRTPLLLPKSPLPPLAPPPLLRSRGRCHSHRLPLILLLPLLLPMLLLLLQILTLLKLVPVLLMPLLPHKVWSWAWG